MNRYYAGIGTHRPLAQHTFRIIDTVEESSTRYHELWSIAFGHGQYVYQIRTVNLLPETRVEWTEKDYPDLDSALTVFNELEVMFK